MWTVASSALQRVIAALPHGETLPEAQWRTRHRGMVWLLWAHAVGLPIVGLLYGFAPWHALLEGGVIAVFAVAAALSIGPRRAQSLVVVLGLLTCSAVLVHITGGLIEAHFHFFVMVAVISLYEDWVPFLAAIAYVLFEHGVMAAFINRDSVFNHPGSAWKWAAIHSGFIAALSVACIVNWRASERQRIAASRLVDALEEGVLLFDRNGQVTAANPSARRVLGVEPELLGGQNGASPEWLMVRSDGSPMPEHERPARRAALTGEPSRDAEIGFRRADGSLIWLRASAHPLRSDPRENPPYAVAESLIDITAQREALDALARSNAELQQFAYVASHDLSEPLRMVSSYLQLLRRRYGGRLDDDAHEFIEHAVEGAGRMRSLIDDLLTYSRAGRGAELEPVDVAIVVAETLQGLAAALVDARADVHVGELPVVNGDAGQLRQVFQNLIANALKFRGGQRACVWIDAAPAPGHPGMVQLSVADAGIGVAPEHRDRIFKMFQRLHDRASYEGTGIGLAICRKIVESHGGQIWVESREGKGTVFRFTLWSAAAPRAPEPALDREPASAV